MSVFKGERKDDGDKNRQRQNVINNQACLVQKC